MARHKFPKIIYFLLCFLLIFQQTGFAQAATVELNIAGHLQSLHSNIFIEKFRPLHLRYLQYDELNNNFKLLLDKGDTKNPKTQDIESTTRDLLNYFFIGISLPNDTFWVNLRPDLPNNIIDPLLAQTEVGKILLESDLELKKDTARFTSPETPEGKEYWNKLYQKAEELYGSQNVTIPTLTRPWIVPDEIIIRESTDSAYVHKATLKVMLEQDYLKGNATYSFKDPREKELNEYSSQIIREKILPKLTKRINVSKDYAPLRQVYYSLILAQWFKARNQNKNTQYSRLIDRKDLSSLQSQTPYSVATYFNAYKENFEKGEYNIKEPTYTPYGQTIRSYFSGGLTLGNNITKQTTILPGSSGFWGGVKRSFLIALTASSLSANAANPAELAVIAQDSQTIGTSTSQTGKTPQGEKPVPQKITWNLNNRGEVEERLKTNSLKTILEVYKLAQQGDETAIKLLKDIAGGRYWGAADLSDRETAAGLLAKLAILDKKDKDLVLWILKLDISPEDTLRALGEAALLEESKFAIGFLKEMTEGKYPSLAPHIKGVALNYSIEYCIKKKDPDSVKWLLNNVIRHLSNKNKLNISEILIGKGTYEDIVKPLIYNENAPLELRIYALGLLPSEGTMELRVSLAKKLLETNKGIPTKALLEDESFWNQEIVKTYYLSVWFVISGHLLDMDNSKRQEKTNKFATEIISSVLLTQGARGVANNMLGINAKDTISHYPTLEIFFGVIAHEFSHRICTHHEAEYDRDASRLNNRAVNEFIADIGAYAFYEIMGWPGAIVQYRESMKPEKPVADSEKSDDPHIPARTAIEQIFLQVEALQRQGRTPPSFLKIFIFSKNHIERYSASYKPGSNNYQEFGELIKDVGKFIEIQSVTSRISGKGDSVHSMAKEAGQEEEGPYGYLSASGKDIVIDVEKAKGAYRKAVPGLTRVNQHKVTGFVHTHEIFHRLARISGVSLSEDESENLANLFAAEAIGLETTPEEDRVLEDFAGRIKDPEARKKFEELLLFPYDSARFLLCLHELFGEDIYNIESRKIDVIPEGAQAMKSGRRATAPAARNGKPAEAGAESKQEKAGLINNALTWFRSKAGYNTSEPSGLVIQFPLEGDQFEIYKGGKKVGYLRYRIDDEMLKLDDLEINNIAEKEAVRQAVIQWFFSMAAQYAGSRGITVLAQAITDPELLDVLIDSNLMSDMRIVGMFDKDYLSISPEEWKKHSRPAYLSVTLRGRLKGNVPVPLIPVVESIHGLRLPNSSDAEFAPTAAEFLIDFLGFDLTPRQETVDNIVRNFRIKDKTKGERGNLDKRWMKVAVLGSLNRSPGNGKQLGLGMLTSPFWAVFGHEGTHFLQEIYRFGYSRWDGTWKRESIPYAVSIYLSALGYGTDMRSVAKRMDSKENAKILRSAFILGYQSNVDSINEGTISNLIQEHFYSTRNEEVWSATAGALIAGVAFKRYVSSGKWQDGRDIIRSMIKRDETTVVKGGVTLTLVSRQSGEADGGTQAEAGAEAERQASYVQDKAFGGSVLRIHNNISDTDVGRALLSEIGLAVTKVHQEARAEANAVGRASHILNNCLPLSKHLARKFPKETAGLLGCSNLHKGNHPEGWRNPIIWGNHWITYITKGNLHIGIDITAKSYIESGLIDAEVFIAGSREELEKKLMEYYGGMSWKTYREMHPVSSKATNKFRVNDKDLDLRDFLEKAVEISFQNKEQKQVLRGILEDYSIDSKDGSIYLQVDDGTVEGRGLNLWNRPPTVEETQRPLLVEFFYVIINIKIYDSNTIDPLTSLMVNPSKDKKTGGIDFRFLPIVTQSMDSLKASIRAMPQSSLQRINLTQEWSDIERLVNSGITPSAERLKDYLAASCFKGNLDSDMDKIVSCISDILRMQEETCCSTDPTLKDILVVLGSGRSGEELKLAFAK